MGTKRALHWEILCKISITNDIELFVLLAVCARSDRTLCAHRMQNGSRNWERERGGGDRRWKEKESGSSNVIARIHFVIFLFVSTVYHRSSVCPRCVSFISIKAFMFASRNFFFALHLLSCAVLCLCLASKTLCQRDVDAYIVSELRYNDV